MSLSPNDDRVIDQREEEYGCWVDAVTEALDKRDDLEAVARKLVGDAGVEEYLKEDPDNPPTKGDWKEMLLDQVDLAELGKHLNAEAYAEAEQRQEHR